LKEVRQAIDGFAPDAGYLDNLATEFAPGQMFIGTDYPYAFMEEDPGGFMQNSH